MSQVYGEDKALPYVVPSPNVRIECPLALVEKVLEMKSAAAQRAADEFARFLFTSEAQVEFGRVGFRPNPKLCKVVPEHMVSKETLLPAIPAAVLHRRFL
jgi:sulfate transport system substrate-binding protein